MVSPKTCLALRATVCLAAAASLSCGGSGLQFQAVLPELVSGPIIPLEGQGVLVVSNQSEQLPVTCLFIRPASTDPNELWGNNRLLAGDPIGPGEQKDFALSQALYDIAILRPSLDNPEAIEGDETHLIQQFFIAGNTVHLVTVNDFTEFNDIAPHCGNP